MESAQQKQLEMERLKAVEQRKMEYIKCCNQLTIEQFKNLRAQIDATIKDTRNLELYALAGLIAYYAWLFTHCIPSVIILDLIPSHLVFWFIPVELPVFGAWRVWSNIRQILMAADYIKKIEDEFDKAPYHIGPDKGWESHLRKIRWEDYLHKIRIRINNYESWKQMPRWKKIQVVGARSHYWPFWLLITALTVFMFTFSPSISKALSKQTCHAPTPVRERSINRREEYQYWSITRTHKIYFYNSHTKVNKEKTFYDYKL